ncbi:uncharacterized protein [Phaenicophaeus curvirostris]|uniref:uncharacterized protein n=1 Tax=Phaenicophaeus curvirostris TaxID=33595 RepID=UPI0037F0CE91
MAPKKPQKKHVNLPVLPSQHPVRRQQEMGKATSAIVLPPCPGSFPRTKEVGKQKPAPQGKPSTLLPDSSCCKKALQEVWQLSAEQKQVEGQWQERRQQAKAELMSWEAWSAGKVEELPQALGTGGTWTPHPPAQLSRMEANKSCRKIKMALPAEKKAAASQLRRLQPETRPPAAGCRQKSKEGVSSTRCGRTAPHRTRHHREAGATEERRRSPS